MSRCPDCGKDAPTQVLHDQARFVHHLGANGERWCRGSGLVDMTWSNPKRREPRTTSGGLPTLGKRP